MLVLRHDFLLEHLVDLGQFLDVETGVTVGAEQGHDQGLDGRMSGAEGVRGHTGVNDVDAGLDGLQMAHGSHARGEMAVQVNRSFAHFLDRLDNGVGVVGSDQTGHVLDTDGVGAHGVQSLGAVHVVLQIIDIPAKTRLGQGVADAALEVLAGLLDAFDNGLEVAIVVEGVEGTEDVHTVLGSALNKGQSGIVGIVAVADQVLGAQQHGERGLLDVALQGAQALPRVLVEEAVHGVEGGAAPSLQGPEADFVHHLGYRDHVLGAATGSKQGLVPIAEAKVHHLDRILCFGPVAGILHGGHFHLVAHCRFLLWCVVVERLFWNSVRKPSAEPFCGTS